MKKSKSYFVKLAAVLAILISIVAIIVIQFPKDRDAAIDPGTTSEERSTTGPASESDSLKSLAKSLGLDEKDFVKIGGVWRPKRDVEPTGRTAPDNERKSLLPNPGSLPILRGDENEVVAGLVKELKQEQPPKEATSLLFAPQPFDRAEYEKDPQGYLEKVRPGRVFQSAEPGPGVTPLTPAGSTYAEVLQGEKVVLRVKAEKGMPVTFHAELGVFDNQLKTTSIAANEDGIAEATFLASRGSVGLVNILAASPVHSEDVLFLVEVALPE